MNIRPRGERTWQLTWQGGRDPRTGKWRRVSETFHGTEKQAQQRWLQRQPEIERGIGVELQGLTVAELWERWLEAKTDLEASTRYSYAILGRTHILPALGRLRVDKLTPLDIQRALTHWQTAPRLDGKPGTLSPRTVNYCRALVVSLLDQAVQWRLVPANVAKLVKGPRQRSKKREEDSWWTMEEAKRFLEAAGQDRFAVAFLLALGGGLREGEILALRWEDVDWKGRTVTIARTLKRTKAGYVIGEPKTEASHRTVPLDESILFALRRQRTLQDRTRDRLGAAYHDADLVLPTAFGTPINPSNLRRTLKRLCAVADVPVIKFHDLRHTHASWLVEQGIDIRTVADRLGHTQVSFTIQVYVHSRVERQREAADAIGQALFGEDQHGTSGQ